MDQKTTQNKVEDTKQFAYSKDKSICAQISGSKVLIYETPIPVYSIQGKMGAKLKLSNTWYEGVVELSP